MNFEFRTDCGVWTSGHCMPNFISTDNEDSRQSFLSGILSPIFDSKYTRDYQKVHKMQNNSLIQTVMECTAAKTKIN